MFSLQKRQWYACSSYKKQTQYSYRSISMYKVHLSLERYHESLTVIWFFFFLAEWNHHGEIHYKWFSHSPYAKDLGSPLDQCLHRSYLCRCSSSRKKWRWVECSLQSSYPFPEIARKNLQVAEWEYYLVSNLMKCACHFMGEIHLPVNISSIYGFCEG